MCLYFDNTYIYSMELKILIILHVIGASIWVGGHLVLALSVLPKALKQKNVKMIQEFEGNFERIGIPALIIQIITGIRLSMIYLPNISEWFSFETDLSKHIALKLILLLLTILLAIHARFFIIPKLSEKTLKTLGWHIIAVTVIAVLFLIDGLSFRLGVLF